MELHPLGRALIMFGAVLVGFGLILLLAQKLPGVGRLPGDILIQRERLTFYFPIASCLLASVVLSLALWMWGRFRP